MKQFEKDYSEDRPYVIRNSKYIQKLDIKDKDALIIVLTKLQSAMVVMSSYYGRFFQAILPMITMVDEYKDDKEMQRFICRKFSSLTRTYIRTDEMYGKESTGLYELKREFYDIELDPEKQHLETRIVVTFKDVDDALTVAMNAILSMGQCDYDIENWKSNGIYDNMSVCALGISESLVQFTRDFVMAFGDADTIMEVNDYLENKRESLINYNNDITTTAGLVLAIEQNMLFLQEIHKIVCNMRESISNGIVLYNPVRIEEDTYDTTELYRGYCEANKEYIHPEKSEKPHNPVANSYGDVHSFNTKKFSFPFFDLTKRKDNKQEENKEEDTGNPKDGKDDESSNNDECDGKS